MRGVVFSALSLTAHSPKCGRLCCLGPGPEPGSEDCVIGSAPVPCSAIGSFLLPLEPGEKLHGAAWKCHWLALRVPAWMTSSHL